MPIQPTANLIRRLARTHLAQHDWNFAPLVGDIKQMIAVLDLDATDHHRISRVVSHLKAARKILYVARVYVERDLGWKSVFQCSWSAIRWMQSCSNYRNIILFGCPDRESPISKTAMKHRLQMFGGNLPPAIVGDLDPATAPCQDAL
ncbi:protein of unknown function [Magnetospirillum sp. XM-1]|nr:protein of unknown function [Magnetospirillum sp. XM-1]